MRRGFPLWEGRALVLNMADESIRPNVVDAATSSLFHVPEDISGPLLAAGPNQMYSAALTLFTSKVQDPACYPIFLSLISGI